MHLGIFTTVFERPTIESTFKAVRENGFDCVQLSLTSAGLAPMPDLIDPEVAARIGRAASTSGVVVSAVSGTYNMIDPSPINREVGLRRLEAIAKACPALGTSIITICTGTRDPENMWRRHPDNDTPTAWHDLLVETAKAVAIAETAGVTLAFEPERANVARNAARGRALLDEIGSPRLKVVIDAANVIDPDHLDRQVKDLEVAFDLLGPHIVIAHGKDLDPNDKFVAAGEGIVDYERYLDLLEAMHFTGPLILHTLTESQVHSSVQFIRSKLPTA
ncbi:MAG TPA: sugar phosphate isomerase/epimerase [Chloroflexota bacterium]|nr:sugar phosphate isomerase/epimerase [Chloroflexota bacterium]